METSINSILDNVSENSGLENSGFELEELAELENESEDMSEEDVSEEMLEEELSEEELSEEENEIKTEKREIKRYRKSKNDLQHEWWTRQFQIHVNKDNEGNHIQGNFRIQNKDTEEVIAEIKDEFDLAAKRTARINEAFFAFSRMN